MKNILLFDVLEFVLALFMQFIFICTLFWWIICLTMTRLVVAGQPIDIILSICIALGSEALSCKIIFFLAKKRSICGKYTVIFPSAATIASCFIYLFLIIINYVNTPVPQSIYLFIFIAVLLLISAFVGIFILTKDNIIMCGFAIISISFFILPLFIFGYYGSHGNGIIFMVIYILISLLIHSALAYFFYILFKPSINDIIKKKT